MSRALQRSSQHALVTGAGTGLTTRLDLAAVGDVATQPARLLVVDVLDLVYTEGADTPASEATATTTAAATTPGTFSTAIACRTITGAGALLLRCL